MAVPVATPVYAVYMPDASRIEPGVIDEGVHFGFVDGTDGTNFWFDKVNLNSDGSITNNNPMLRVMPFGSVIATDENGYPVQDFRPYASSIFKITIVDQHVVGFRFYRWV
ncbi:MAG: hypothetical protein QOD72_1265 [Acidimicrobiaceae bacterium]|nr:hypothetical protein [Acidimicrobiaceae bacterium]